MAEDNLPLISIPGSCLAAGTLHDGRIVGEMVGGALALTPAAEAASNALTARFRIGQQDLCEPDYRQILLWAAALKMEPEALLERLESPLASTREELLARPELMLREIFGENAGIRIEDGKIVDLYWEISRLPLEHFEWVEQLWIRRLWIEAWQSPDGTGATLSSLSIPLKELDELQCIGVGLSRIDLAGAGNLTQLRCQKNRIDDLNLSTVPLLTYLNCSENHLAELDLPAMPNLKLLNVSDVGSPGTELEFAL